MARLRDDFFHTVVYVVFGMFRYLHVISQADGWDTPEEIVLRDQPMALCLVLWTLDILVNIYVRPFPF